MAPSTSTDADARSPAAPIFAEAALLLGLPFSESALLARQKVFRGPTGLSCQVLRSDVSSHSELPVRPLVRLGLRGKDLDGDQIERLLSVQAALLSQGRWYLGASHDGELQVTSLASFDSARDIAASMDMANMVAWTILQLLMQDPPPSPEGEAAADGQRAPRK